MESSREVSENSKSIDNQDDIHGFPDTRSQEERDAQVEIAENEKKWVTDNN